MTKFFEESDITIETLDAHLRDSGLVPYNVQPDSIRLRTEQGIGYRISLSTDRKFVRFATYLPVNKLASLDQKHALAKRLNEEVFLPVFVVDADEDLTVTYVLPYAHGLFAGNFIAIVNRFASLLEFIVETYSGDGLIDFGAPTAVPDVTDTQSKPDKTELFH
ncbi:YbjN domain-containing protein [Paraburkholderia strydomiana]|uniref:YbjN domain-containing protein n=1 Tax=Paraburkholderia strydomiana TaxID=1245417 RepID=UPI0038B85C24